MKEFFVGLMVILAFLLLSILAVFLMPFIVVLGFALKWVITVAFLVFAIWAIGKITLLAINRVKQ